MWRSAAGSSTWTQIGSTVTNTSYFEAGQSWQIGWGAYGSAVRVDDFGGGQTTTSPSTGTKLKISDLHGDVVSEVPNTTGGTASLLSPIDVFGAPTTTAGANLGLGYLATKQRNTTLTTGTIEMGARLYQPQIGRFLQTDPIYGGSLNAYDYANQDPGDQADLNGESGGPYPPCGTKHDCGYYTNKYCKKKGSKCGGAAGAAGSVGGCVSSVVAADKLTRFWGPFGRLIGDLGACAVGGAGGSAGVNKATGNR